jgi:hypothetical protein
MVEILRNVCIALHLQILLPASHQLISLLNKRIEVKLTNWHKPNEVTHLEQLPLLDASDQRAYQSIRGTHP